MFPTLDTPSESAEHLTCSDDDVSSRSLEDVGATAVLGAMVEQRRRSSSVPPPLEADDSDVIATQRRDRIAPNDDVFQKIR